MTQALLVDEKDTWIEIHRNEALERIERFMTEDLAAIEVDYAADETAIGIVESFTWIIITDGDEQLPVLLMLKDPARPDAYPRWFLHRDLTGDPES